MRYVSIFSGIEAASVAWEPLGWEPMAFAEIEPFPCAVLAKRYPNVPNLGDVTKIDWRAFLETSGRPDVVVGGSPCQSFSIAGNREGLSGASGLMYEYIRAVQELRPSWFIWENVPGCLSVEKGRAFEQLLSEMADSGYGLAWRVLDAQFTRVPVYSATDELEGFIGPVAQRRRRVFLVGSLGNDRACDVLFEPESMSGHLEPSRKKREALTRAARGSSASGSRSDLFAVKTSETGANGSNVNSEEVAYTLSRATEQAVAFTQNVRDEVRYISGDGTCTGAICSDHGAKGQTYVMASAAANTEITQGGLCPTIAAHASKDAPILCVGSDTSKPSIDENVSGTLHVGGLSLHLQEGRRIVASNGKDHIASLCARDWKGVSSQCVTDGKVIVEETADSKAVTISDGSSWIVRRLTPTECERLMGFPDGWTDIGEWTDEQGRKRRATDSNRYKALGNSFAVPVIMWLGTRIEQAERRINGNLQMRVFEASGDVVNP